MKITKKLDAIFLEKETGTRVNYFLFDEYELHYNEIPSGSKQDFHHHEKISETFYIFEGELTIEWRDDMGDHTEVVTTGDEVELENSPHTISNESSSDTKFLVIKQVLQGENHRDLFKHDKILDKQ